MANLSPNASQLAATGTGEETLSLSGWGTNESRLARSFKYRLYDAGGVQQDTLIVTQAGTELGIRVNGNASKSATSGSSSVTVTFNGYSNGRYIRFQNDNSSSQLVVSSAKEYSASQTGADFSSSFTEVSSFGSWYEFSVTVSIPANASASTYSFSVYTSDDTYTTQSVTYSVVVTESGVDVDNVELNQSSVIINQGETYSGLSATVYPINASDKRVTWSSDDSNKVTVSNTGSIYGVALTSIAVGIKATSVADSTKYDYCYVTVVEAGSITVGDVNALKNQDSVAVPVTLYNIDTNRPITITVTSGTSWVTNIGSYDSSQHAVTLGISRNLTTDDRSTTVTVSGYDLAGEERTGSGTLSQNGVDDIDLISLSVSGDVAINDDGTTPHRYVVTYNPSTTSETGVTWDVVDSQGNSVDGTLVDIGSTTSTYCDITVLSGADGDNVFVKATSTVRPSISATQAVTVTYTPVIAELQVSPTSLSVQWDSTTDSTPVVTWSNVQTPYIPTNGGWSGFITSASLNTTNGKITTEYSANSSTSSQSGSVTVYALKDGEVNPISVTVNYTQAGMPDPSTFSSVGVSNLTVSGGAKASFSAEVGFQNSSNTSFSFPGTLSYSLYGYESREDTSSSAATLLTSGTATEFSDGREGVRYTVAANSNPRFTLERQWIGTLGMNTYFVLEISMSGYNIPSTDYDSTL